MRFDEAPVLKIARVYLRVSTDLERQESIIEAARAAGYYVAGVYREKASGARPDRPELLRMVADLQPGEVIIAERLGRRLSGGDHLLGLTPPLTGLGVVSCYLVPVYAGPGITPTQ